MIRLKRMREKYKTIVIWENQDEIIQHNLNEYGISYIVDINEHENVSIKYGYQVKDPQVLLEEKEETTAVIICSSKKEEIKAYARNIGITCDLYDCDMVYPNLLKENDWYSQPELVEEIDFEGRYSIEKNTQIMISLMKAHGVKKVIVSPGGTNISFINSIQNDSFFEIYSCSDERSAAYMACGMAAESGEVVALNCTGATASRNYMPGLTEAYYRKLPILTITSSQYLGRIGHNCAQVTDRVNLPSDIAKLSVQIPMIRNGQDKWYAEAEINKALIELKRKGSGPVHINLVTDFLNDCSIKALPAVKVIKYYNASYQNQSYPDIHKGKIAIFVGSHLRWSENLKKKVEEFCEKYDAIVICDQTSNYRGEYCVMGSLILMQSTIVSAPVKDIKHQFDLMIQLGDITGSDMRIVTKQIWRVSPDGQVRDTFARLQAVFEMEEEQFFEIYCQKKYNEEKNNVMQLEKWKAEYDRLYNKIPELPFSNIWIAKEMSNLVPKNAILYLGILNSLRSWNYFNIKENVTGYSNVGGFGIEGGMSSLVGCALASPNALAIGVVGDLGFFSDMNVLGNRHLPKNVRILLINNGGGAEFYQKNSRGIKVIGEESVGRYCAAEGHYGKKSKTLVKEYVENLGIKYITASSKEKFSDLVSVFFNELEDVPILFEIFTDLSNESLAGNMICNLDSIKGNEL